MAKLLLFILGIMLTQIRAEEKSFTMDDMQNLSESSGMIFKLGMKCAELATNVYQEMNDSKEGELTLVRRMKLKEHEEFYQSTIFDIKTVEDVSNELNKAISNELEYILLGNFGQFLDTMRAVVIEQLHYVLSQNQKASLFYYKEIFTLLAVGVQERVRTIAEDVRRRKLVDNKMSIHLKKQSLLRVNADYQKYQLTVILQTLLMDIILAADPNIVFMTEEYEKFRFLLISVFTDLKTFRLFKNEWFAKNTLGPLFIKVLAIKYAKTRDFYYKKLFIEQAVVGGISMLPEKIKRIVLREIITTNIHGDHQNLNNQENGEYFKQLVSHWYGSNGIDEKQFMPKINFKFEKERDVFRFDYLACNPERIMFTEFSEDDIRKLILVSSNPNNSLFFLQLWKYLNVEEFEELGTAAVEPLYRHLYQVYVEMRTNGVEIPTEKTWVYNIVNFYYRHWSTPENKEFIGITVILSKMLFDQSIDYYYRQYAEGTIKWLELLSISHQFVIDYIRTPQKYLPPLRINLVSNLIIPITGELKESERRLLKSSEATNSIVKMVESGTNVFKMTEIDNGFESEEDVYVAVVRKNLSKADFKKHLESKI